MTQMSPAAATQLSLRRKCFNPFKSRSGLRLRPEKTVIPECDPAAGDDFPRVTVYSLFSIYSSFPELDVAGSIPVSRSIFSIN